MHQIRQIIASSACLAAVLTQAPLPRQYTFSRPTIVAIAIGADPIGDRLVFEDDSYRFIERSGARPQELFIHGKRQGGWIHVLRITTEHGRFGHSSFMVQRPWDDGRLINEEFATLPLNYGRSVERVVRDDSRDGYRLDFGVQSDVTSEPTSFWMRASDIDAAIRDQRQPVSPPRRIGVESTKVTTDPALFAPVQVNRGEHLYWSIDTSARDTVFDPATAPHDEPITRQPPVANLNVAGRLLTDVPLVFARLRGIENHAVGGVLGSALLDRFVVTVDDDRHTLDLIEPDAFDDRDAGHGVATDWRAGVPVVRVNLVLNDGRRIQRRLVVGTADPQALVLRPSTANGLPATDRAGTVELGDLRVRDVPIAIREPRNAVDEVDGAIGMTLLRRFRVTFDKRRHRILLAPASLLNVPFDYDASGVRIVANGRRFGIGDLLPGFATESTFAANGRLFSIDDLLSRAGSEPGFRVGDWIDAFDDRTVTGWTLEQIRSALRADGRRHTVTVERFGQAKRITFRAPTASTSR